MPKVRFDWATPVLVIVLVATALALPGRLSGQTTPAPAAPAACAAAQELLDAALPQQARELVLTAIKEDKPPAECLYRQLQQAQTSIADAEERAQEARSPGLSEQDVLKAVAKARELDKQNATLLAIDAENATRAAADKKANWVTGRKDDWDAFSSDSLSPLEDIGLPFLAVLVGLLLVARLVTGLPKPSFWGRTTEPKRLAQLALGLVSAAACAGVVVLWLAEPGSVRVPAAVLAVMLAAGSVYLLARAFATRRRISVEVTSAEGDLDPGATGQVIALLNELGAEAPKGVEVPVGSDVSALEGTAIVGTPEGRIAKALYRAWRLALGTTPWRLRVDTENENRLSFAVTRNGRSVSGGVIERDQLWVRSPILPDTPSADAEAPSAAPGSATDAAKGSDGKTPETPDLHKFAAAALVCELGQSYDDISKDLHGVTDWRSLGLHYIATTDYAAEANVEARKAVLAHAIELDTNNLPARAYLRFTQDRASTDWDTLINYSGWLNALIEFAGRDQAQSGRKGDEADPDLKMKPGSALWLRTNMTLLAVACNLASLDKPADRDEGDRRTAVGLARKTAREFIECLRAANPGPLQHAAPTESRTQLPVAGGHTPCTPESMDARRLAGSMKMRAAAAFLHLTASGQSQQPSASEQEDTLRSVARAWLNEADGSPQAPVVNGMGPAGHYNYACYLAARAAEAPRSPDGEELLRVAVEHLRLADALPELCRYREEDPALKALREKSVYKNAFLREPRSDIFDLEVFRQHAAPLRQAGLHRPGVLATQSEWDVARLLKTDRVIARHLIRAARLAADLERTASSVTQRLHGLHMEVLAGLLEQGVDSPEALRARVRSERPLVLADEVRAFVLKQCRTEFTDASPLPRQEVGTWLLRAGEETIVPLVAIIIIEDS